MTTDNSSSESISHFARSSNQFDDGRQVDVNDPTIVYPAAGIYQITVNAENPYFTFRKEFNEENNGIIVYNSNQCPYSENMTQELERYAGRHNLPIEKFHIRTPIDAQTGNHPYGTFYFNYMNKVTDFKADSRYLVKILPVE